MNSSKLNLGNQTIDKLKSYITKNGLKYGDKLPTESQLVELLGVGRSTVREAIKVLSFANIVEVKQGSGTYVKTMLSVKTEDAKLRATVLMIEKEAISELMEQNVTDDEWLLLKAKLSRRNQLLQEGEFEKYLDADIDFHTSIVNLARNNYLSQWYRELQSQWHIHLSKQIITTKDYEGNKKLHDLLFNKLVERDKEKAIETMGKLGKRKEW